MGFRKISGMRGGIGGIKGNETAAISRIDRPRVRGIGHLAFHGSGACGRHLHLAVRSDQNPARTNRRIRRYAIGNRDVPRGFRRYRPRFASAGDDILDAPGRIFTGLTSFRVDSTRFQIPFPDNRGIACDIRIIVAGHRVQGARRCGRSRPLAGIERRQGIRKARCQ
ncbi:MAG: hypothetical protein BWY57_02793 [Betaproteobacteria bacterium ADurb.Bin341]|nr:MAG: hypothetical protein BWY57_02793 [Betaproteobacteria bacterium ADurb.Bin341]